MIMTLFQLLFEVVKKDTEFEFSAMIQDAWQELLHAEQDAVGIHFDLENDNLSSCEKSQIIDIGPKSAGEDHTKVLAQPCTAGGDWQSPVCYFRCQLIRGRSRHELFIVIPTKEEGNISLTPGEKEGTFRPCDNNEANVPNWKDLKWKPLWDALKKHATERIQMLASRKEGHRLYHDYEIRNIRKKS